MSRLEGAADSYARSFFDASPLDECSHERAELRRRTLRNGSVQFIKQCLDCGESVGQPVAHAKVDGEPEPFHEKDASKDKADREERYQARRREFFERYDEYLRSDAWKAKRARVLARDKRICQGCGDTATQVHHLTYARVGDELLLDLTSVCGDCHARLHED